MADTQFPSTQTWQWDPKTETVQFAAKILGRNTQCRITVECLRDHFGAVNTGDSALSTAAENEDAVTMALVRLAKKQQTESDGGLLLRSGDLAIR